jgi:hypothetical protein
LKENELLSEELEETLRQNVILQAHIGRLEKQLENRNILISNLQPINDPEEF